MPKAQMKETGDHISIVFYDRDGVERDRRKVRGPVTQSECSERLCLIDTNGLAHCPYDGGRIEIGAYA